MAGENLEKRRLHLGFIPLTDCAPLVIAHEKGYFRKYGLEVALSRESSWANIRDKVAAGVFDGAHMLAPLAIATTLGLEGIKKATIAPLALDLNGNAVTLATELYPPPLRATGTSMSATGLRHLIGRGKRRGLPRFASVYPCSSHTYLLRYWFAAAGIDPGSDLDLSVIPPPQMPACLESGEVAGYCVGEPWNECAVARGIGHAWTTSYEIWNNHPEKVLGVNQDWAEAHPNTLQALLMALLEAACWIDRPENRIEVATILSAPPYVDAPVDVVKMSMIGTFCYTACQSPVSLPDFNVFYRYAATFPWRSHALWFLTQMVRWGQIAEPINFRRIAETVYRPDLYRQAAGVLGIPVPEGDLKPEGIHAETWTLETPAGPLSMGPDWFCDGKSFNPDDPVGYLADFAIHRRKVGLKDLGACNP
ncbi:MAG: CmpA/NrtA family ABC transporter substrate-binding protein [Methylohalobius crimeensis]